MPNPSIAGTYFTYKQQTGYVADWLLQTAQSHGYKQQDQKLTKSKKKQPKPIEPFPVSKSGYIILNARRFEEIADYVVNQGKVLVPQLVLSLLQSTIRLRTKVNKLFATLSPRSQPSNKKHEHFVQILERVYGLLLPSAQAGRLLTDDELPDIGALTIGATVEESFTVNVPSPVAQRKTKTKKLAPVDLAEDDEEEGLLLQLLCMFSDLHELREHLNDVWQQYKDGKMDLVTAAVITDTALEMVRKLEAGVLQSTQLWSFEQLQGVVFLAGCASYNIDPNHRRGPKDLYNYEAEPFGEWLYASIYSTLSSIKDVIEPGCLPINKKGHFGLYDANHDRSKMTLADKIDEDRIILMEMLTEFSLLANGCSHHGIDELSKEWCALYDRRKISTALVFGSQIFLDIHHLLRKNVSRPFKELQVFGKQTQEIIARVERASSTFMNWSAHSRRNVVECADFIETCILSDSPGKFLSRYEPNADREPFKLLKEHPLYCGILQFTCQIMVRGLGEAIAVSQGTIPVVAQLYHALKLSKHLQLEWTAMTRLLKIHSLKTIFCGKVPKTMLECGIQSMMSLKAHNDWITESTALVQIFENKYLSHRSDAFTEENVVTLLRESKVKVNNQSGMSMIHKLQILDPLIRQRSALTFDYLSMTQTCWKLCSALHEELEPDLLKFLPRYCEQPAQLPFVCTAILTLSVQGRQGPEKEAIIKKAGTVVERFIKRQQ